MLKSIASVCARGLVRHSHFALGLAFVITLAAGLSASGLRFDFSPDAIYLAGDKAHHAYVERYLPHFAARGGTAVVAVEGNITKEHTQRALRALHDRLRQEPSVHIRAMPVAAKGLEGLEASGEATGVAKQSHVVGKATQQSPWQVARDGSAAMIQLQLPLYHGDELATQTLARRLRHVVDEVASQHPQVTVYLTGGALIQEATVGFLKRDQMVFIPLLILCIALFLALSFRDIRGVVLPFMTTGVATLWVLGWLGAVGHSFNIINNALIVLLIVIGIADSVHIFARFQDELRGCAPHCVGLFFSPESSSILSGGPLPKASVESKHSERLQSVADKGAQPPQEVVTRVIQAMIGPCLLTSGTTALGFASSVVAQVPIVREFGLDAAVGVMGAFVATFLMMPALLQYSYVNRKDMIHRVSTTQGNLLLGKMACWSMRHAKVLAIVATVVSLGAVWTAKDLQSNQRLISDLPESDEAVQGVRFIERTFAGVSPVTVLFERKGKVAPAVNSEGLTDWHNPAVLRSIDRIAQAMQADSLSPVVHSYPQALRALLRSVTGADPGPVGTWDNAQIAQANQLVQQAHPELLQGLKEAFFSQDGSLQVMHGLLRDTHTRELNRFRTAMQQAIDQHGVVQAPGILTGSAIVVANALGNIIRDMVGSLMAACITILLVIAAVFRSLRYALVALLPNVLPLVVTLAAMVFLHVDLRVATVMIFSMALGISVDACTHLLSRLREELDDAKETDSKNHLQNAVARTMQGSGRPVVVSTGLLLLGFSVMGLSRFGALRDFAILAGIILGTALMVDLLLLPALIVLVRPRT